jgi:hypothetical protein
MCARAFKWVLTLVQYILLRWHKMQYIVSQDHACLGKFWFAITQLTWLRYMVKVTKVKERREEGMKEWLFNFFFSSDTVKTQNIKIIIWVSWPFHESITNSPATTLVNLKQPFTSFCARAKFGFYVFFMNR